LPHHLAVDWGGQPVTSRSEVLGNWAIRGEKALRMAWGLESSHTPFSLAGRLMGILGAVMQIPMLPMFHTGQELAQCRPVAFEFVHDDHPRHIG
jgi:hypothetical protein